MLATVVSGWRTRAVLAALWWRHAYSFAFAHRPLCDRHRDGVLRVGHVHLCRSCVLLYAAAAATALTASFADLPYAAFVPGFYALMVGVLVLSYPTLYERFPRSAKDMLRVAAGVLLVLLVVFPAYGPVWLGVLNIAAFAVGYRVSLNEFRRWKQHACDGCPELGLGRICGGYCQQADAVRNYVAAAEGYLLRRGADRWTMLRAKDSRK